MSLRPEVIGQGDTTAVYLENCRGYDRAEGEFQGKRIVFLRSNANPDVFRGLLPIPIWQEPGRYPIRFSLYAGPSVVESGQAHLTVRKGTFGSQTVQIPQGKKNLLSTSLLEQENAKVLPLISTSSPTQHWQGRFHVPVTGRTTSSFGLARVYNTGELQSRHLGVDIAATTGTPIKASSRGRVVFAEEVRVRGKAVFIDHGQGVFTGYYHLSELSVQPGQEVAAGHIIGAMGSTGRATASHLHWCVRVNGVFVNPLQWTEVEF